MARGGHRSKNSNGTDNVKFQASISASTLTRQPPYNRYFSVPIPEVDQKFYEALKREIQRQKAYSNEQKIAFAEAEAAKNASLFEARKCQIEAIQSKLQHDEVKAEDSKLLLHEVGAKVEASTRILQDLLEKKSALEEVNRKRAAIAREETKSRIEKTQEESRKLQEERQKLRSKIESLKDTLRKEEDMLDKITKVEDEYIESKGIGAQNIGKKISIKRKRDGGDKNGGHGVLSIKKRKHDISQIDESKHGESTQFINSPSSKMDISPENESLSKPSGGKIEKVLKEASDNDLSTKMKASIEDREKDKLELKKIQGEVNGLNQTKSQMIWLLKQVINEEKKQKVADKKRMEDPLESARSA